MKNNLILVAFILYLSMACTGCELVKGIFNAGMLVGIFITVIVVVGIIALVLKAGKGK